VRGGGSWRREGEGRGILEEGGGGGGEGDPGGGRGRGGRRRERGGEVAARGLREIAPTTLLYHCERWRGGQGERWLVDTTVGYKQQKTPVGCREAERVEQ
jgi:hypothetical protein